MIVTCSICKKDCWVRATPEQIERWKAGELIQRAMPNVPAAERELLISGVCNTCFDAMFPEDK